MEINWITVSAQVVNFLILVWLLKRFLYQPVIRAMDRREQKIQNRMDEANSREQEAIHEKQSYQQKLAGFEKERDDLLEETRQEARQTRSQMLDQAREETARVRSHWMREIREEKTAFIDGLRHQSLDVVETVIRKALQDLADEHLEDRIAHTFVRQLHTLDDATREAMRRSSEPATVATSFELDPAQRGTLTRSIHELIGADLTVNYTRAPELICGIELTCESQRISWNLSDYLDELSASIERAFEPLEPTGAGG
ncbi:F0F1 ATP synthase subunit B [Marinobacter pelagius]|uniref:F0F1 ATP synthase subunit B n=1 Tax=Marinobacter sp. C7 TaxID=2951363 RepID=UPI001EF0D2A4|nr:F0F1 ATP synthase subunit B [Marinobacter sp. C7]MCG7199970.1 F0F1 ATP synthase subunit B [Marinobacter sp. C7]